MSAVPKGRSVSISLDAEKAVSGIWDAPSGAKACMVLAHGAGAAMDSEWMNKMADGLGKAGLRVIRFEFAYMAARRVGERKPPPKAERVMGEYRAAVAEAAVTGPLFIGGKSMGGRVASMVADGLHAEGKIAGLLCLGYPFHPQGKPQQLRTAHLATLKTPALIAQGTRDPFGTIDEVPAYTLSDRIEIFWLEDGDHDLKPRKKMSGFAAADHMAKMARKVRDWSDRLR